MERCKTCQHWQPIKDDEWDAVRGTGTCLAAREIWKVTESLQDPTTHSDYLALRPEHAGVLSMVADGSSYRAELVTMPDFGCVQWKAG